MSAQQQEEHLFFYDLYRGLLEDTMAILQDPDRQRALAHAQGIDALREHLLVDPSLLYRVHEVPPNMRSLYQQLCRCRPYQLVPAVTTLAREMVEKAGTTPINHRGWLNIPLWVEFERTALGSDDLRIVALFFYYDEKRQVRCDLLQPDMQQAKILQFASSSSAQWHFEQMGPCAITACPRSAQFQRDMPFLVGEAEQSMVCDCYQAGFSWSQIAKAINHLLLYRKKPLVETTLVREIPIPHSSGRLTRKQKEENSAARWASRRNVIAISLSAPVHTMRSVRGESQGIRFMGETDEKQPVDMHWKVLIPGEGKPWKDFQILLIDSYERAQPRSQRQTRYRVIE